MLFNLRLPNINPYMSTALVENVYAEPGSELLIGAKIFDLSIDLSSAFSQDCPPISYYRVVSRERVWLRRLLVAPGEGCEAGGEMAILSSDPNEPLDGTVARSIRVTTAGIVYHAAMWSGRETCLS